jgi:hypothetical protein
VINAKGILMIVNGLFIAPFAILIFASIAINIRILKKINLIFEEKYELNYYKSF